MNTARRSSVAVAVLAALTLSLSAPAFASRPAREVTLRELEELLRERERRAGRSRGAEPRRETTSRRSRASHALVMPVAGVTSDELQDSFGDPRSGGRSHMGIDIFAPRWTEVVAASAGTLTAIDFGERSGRSLWLVGRDGRAYFYAHLQEWARGIYDGKQVVAGDVIGYVGNSGNAAGSPTHLHFEVREQGRVVNPYPVLARAEAIGGPVRVARSRWPG